MVARLGAAPSVSSSQARRIAVFLARDVEIGGLCGHCSRDLPLDRRLLFVAELTGQKWCGVRVMLPTGPNRLRFYRPARVFSELPPHEAGCGTWNAWRDSADHDWSRSAHCMDAGASIAPR